jgi:hypothetical protein
MEFLEDGSLILTMTAHSPLEVISWVLSLGSAAELLEPDWLQEDIQAEIAAMADKNIKLPALHFPSHIPECGTFPCYVSGNQEGGMPHEYQE